MQTHTHEVVIGPALRRVWTVPVEAVVSAGMARGLRGDWAAVRGAGSGPWDLSGTLSMWSARGRTDTGFHHLIDEIGRP